MGWMQSYGWMATIHTLPICVRHFYEIHVWKVDDIQCLCLLWFSTKKPSRSMLMNWLHVKQPLPKRGFHTCFPHLNEGFHCCQWDFILFQKIPSSWLDKGMETQRQLFWIRLLLTGNWNCSINAMVFKLFLSRPTLEEMFMPPTTNKIVYADFLLK